LGQGKANTGNIELSAVTHCRNQSSLATVLSKLQVPTYLNPITSFLARESIAMVQKNNFPATKIGAPNQNSLKNQTLP
jgi:hypothetical protein